MSAAPALARFGHNLRQAPRRFVETMFRSGPPRSDRTRSTFVFGNVFLHLHPARTHRWSLRWATTWGLGIASISAFLITLITGVLLMFYYKPYVGVAYDSIKDIHFVVPTGRFIRNIHRWAGNIMVVAVLLHMARVFYTAAYRRPREFNWVIGMLLLVVTLGLAFTGYLLPWDQLAYWAITIGANIAQSPREVTDAVGLTEHFDIGGLQRQLLLGSDVVGEEELSRDGEGHWQHRRLRGRDRVVHGVGDTNDWDETGSGRRRQEVPQPVDPEARVLEVVEHPVRARRADEPRQVARQELAHHRPERGLAPSERSLDRVLPHDDATRSLTSRRRRGSSSTTRS